MPKISWKSWHRQTFLDIYSANWKLLRCLRERASSLPKISGTLQQRPGNWWEPLFDEDHMFHIQMTEWLSVNIEKSPNPQAKAGPDASACQRLRIKTCCWCILRKNKKKMLRIHHRIHALLSIYHYYPISYLISWSEIPEQLCDAIIFVVITIITIITIATIIIIAITIITTILVSKVTWFPDVRSQMTRARRAAMDRKPIPRFNIRMLWRRPQSRKIIINKDHHKQRSS